MTSNSKLSAIAKAQLKQYKSNMPKNMAFGTYGNITVLICRESRNTIKVSTAIASDDESKFRNKVGQYLCMLRMRDGNAIVMPYDVYCDNISEYAHYIAETLNGV